MIRTVGYSYVNRGAILGVHVLDMLGGSGAARKGEPRNTSLS